MSHEIPKRRFLKRYLRREQQIARTYARRYGLDSMLARLPHRVDKGDVLRELVALWYWQGETRRALSLFRRYAETMK